MLYRTSLLPDWERLEMLTNREIAIYALGKTEGVNSIAETLGKGLDDEKYIESWNKTIKLLGIEMPLKDLEKIYNEFAKKMDEVVKNSEDAEKVKSKKQIIKKSGNKPWKNFICDQNQKR